MKAVQQGFRSLVEDAYSGDLVLPEFQRKWVWKRLDVLRLFDSIRKDYPIGGFLTLEASDRLNLSPRVFEGVDNKPTEIRSYVLDGQQRITAGLALYYGIGKSYYFLNLRKLWEKANEANLDYDDEVCLREFANDLDEGDEYIQARALRSTDPDSLLEREHLLWTPNLTNDTKFDTAAERYLNRYPDRSKLIRRLVSSFFKISTSQPIVSVTVLDAGMPVEAITRVFEMLNTSGQRLTPVEIVVAVLFAQGIHLRQELEDIQEQTTYYCNMETTGEIFLQTIALLDDKNPKKTSLPKTITRDNYGKFKEDAKDYLELAGKFLTNRFGMGLDATNRLVQYDAMLPPLGIVLAEIERQHPQPSPTKEHWQQRIERWFVGAVLNQEYTESQPATQKRHTEELLRWVRAGDDFAPDWLASVRVRAQERVTPNSAIGKLIACLISQRAPKDPLNNAEVGGKSANITSSQSHHIFPKAFCEDHIPNWNPLDDKHDLALNIMPLTKQTNRLWNKMDPANQVSDVENEWEGKSTQLYAPFFINERCLAIMKKPNKRRDDYHQFISERGKLVQTHITNRWGFSPDANQVEDEEEI